MAQLEQFVTLDAGLTLVLKSLYTLDGNLFLTQEGKSKARKRESFTTYA